MYIMNFVVSDILLPNGRAKYIEDGKSDWQNDIQKHRLISTFDMKNWVLLFTKRDENIALSFFKTLKSVAEPMGMQVGSPQM